MAKELQDEYEGKDKESTDVNYTPEQEQALGEIQTQVDEFNKKNPDAQVELCPVEEEKSED